MLRFLFGWTPKADEPMVETQREELERLVREMNAAIAVLPEKPKLIIDPASGELDLDLPQTLPDEALALPAPEGGDENKEPAADVQAA